jgi:hypothetical protein
LRSSKNHRIPLIGLGGQTDVFFHALLSVQYRLGDVERFR